MSLSTRPLTPGGPCVRLSPDQGTYKKSLDGNDLGSALYSSSSSCNFGTGNRFNPFVFMAHSPAVGKLYTDSPGPCYSTKTTIGTGPSARFPAGPKMQMTPEERTRLKCVPPVWLWIGGRGGG